jgi:glutamine phosphoribosylpyrophosphate amidotransferase
MRPLNTRERRIQFTRFLLLFLLAVLPIVLLVWLHGRVDHVENDFLREHYVSNQLTAENDSQREKLFKDVRNKAADLNDLIANNADPMKTFEKNTNMSSNISGRLQKLKDAIGDFKLVLSATKEDSVYLAIVDLSNNLQMAASNLNDVYGTGHALVMDKTNQLIESEKISEKRKKAFDKCNGLLMPGQKIDPDLE